MRGTSITAVAVAVVLMVASIFFVSNSFFQFDRAVVHIANVLANSSQWKYERLSRRCNDSIGEKYCRHLLSPLHFVFKDLGDIYGDFRYQLRRSKIPKSELPILRIYMTDGALGKLQKKRNITLSKKTPILLSSDDDWVKATIIGEDGKNQRRVNVKLRLKGDWVDHIKDSKKLSFRIKVENNGSVFGMSKFSIHDPRTRHGEKEALALAMQRLIGVLSPRYFFVDVKVNEQSVGIMALEEHFTKEMVEAQNRRVGPIVAIDEDWMWRQWDRYGAGTNLNLGLNDYPIKTFRSGTYIRGEPRSELNIRASSILRDLVDGKVPGYNVFDPDLVSRWWIMNNVFGSSHSSRFHNRRFYFNPINQRLEPIPFDNMVGLQHERFSLDFAVTSLLGSENFRTATLANLSRIEAFIGSEEFRAWLSPEQERYNRILSLDSDDIEFNPIKPAELLEQLFLLSQQVNLLFEASPINAMGKVNPTIIQGLFDVEREKIADGENDSSFFVSMETNESVQYYTHLRPFWFWSQGRIIIQIKNVTMDMITVNSMVLASQPRKNLLTSEILIPPFEENSNNHVQTVYVDAPEIDYNEPMLLTYSYQGNVQTKPVILQFRNYESGYENQEIARAWFEKNGVTLDQATKTITFGPGNYSLETSLETEKDWKIQFLPGAALKFKQGARLKVNGPIHALGMKELPVKFLIESDPNLGLLGSWGGLLVLEANRESILRHTQVIGAATQGFSERQDSHGLTGCITFYKSNVRIEHSRFSGLQCEDALNIISSDFNIDHVEFVDSSADAFDSDFSEGVVSNSVFRNIVNDGIDVSGSQVQVSSSRFSYIRDKAISVGEGSTLDATELIIVDADAGVVSKDKSVVKIRNSSFKDVNNALMAYVKKEAWGPAEIHCDNCLFDHVESVAVEQYASRITIDGQEVSPTPFSRKQLQIAGYTQ